MKNWKLNAEDNNRNMFFFDYAVPNSRGETMTVCLIKCENSGRSNSILNNWIENGYVDKTMQTWWSVDVFVNDSAGTWERYNPTVKPHIERDHKGKIIACRSELNFDWILEATEENAEKLLQEIEHRFLEEER